MKFYFSLIILLTFGSAYPLAASECVGTASTCTPNEICVGATVIENGIKVWASSPSVSSFVASAKALGMTCGVIEQQNRCKLNAAECTIDELCDASTFEIDGKKAWLQGFLYQKHVKLAKSYGLSCEVEIEALRILSTREAYLKVVDKNGSKIFDGTLKSGDEVLLPITNSPFVARGGMAGSVYVKIDDQTYGPIGIGTSIFKNFTLSAENIRSSLAKSEIAFLQNQAAPEITNVKPKLRPKFDEHMQLSKDGNASINKIKPRLREIDNKAKTIEGLNDRSCLANPGVCSEEALCNLATTKQNKQLRWSDEIKSAAHVTEAKSRGLNCNIKLACSSGNLSMCSDSELCGLATVTAKNSSRKIWVKNSKYNYAEVAKARGLSCDVNAATTAVKVKPQVSIVSSIQNQLNRIGCSVGTADGVIGPKTRKGLYAFTMATGINYHPKLLRDESFLSKLRSYPPNTCKKHLTQKSVSSPKAKSTPNISSDNSPELVRLQKERDLLEANINAMQMLMEQQRRDANRAYKLCFGNCAMNNRAGRGNTLYAINECNKSCAPLRYGGAVVPPSWEQSKKKLETINCNIMRLSNTHITANCR